MFTSVKTVNIFPWTVVIVFGMDQASHSGGRVNHLKRRPFMDSKLIMPGGIVLAVVPELRIYLTIICVILFAILAIQIWLMLHRCKERNRRLQALSLKKGR